MSLRKAQNITTVIFVGLMLLNLLAAVSLSSKIDLAAYIKVYGVHLSIILSYYFFQHQIELKEVPKFTLGLLIVMLLIWNALIFKITLDYFTDSAMLNEKLQDLPQWGGFLIAGGIAMLFNGKVAHDSNTPQSSAPTE